MQKILMTDYQKCTGCRLCELVCSVMHEGVSNPARSRIKVMKWESEGLYVPMSCQQCEDAPCMNVCPVKAISHDEDFGFLKVDYERLCHCPRTDFRSIPCDPEFIYQRIRRQADFSVVVLHNRPALLFSAVFLFSLPGGYHPILSLCLVSRVGIYSLSVLVISNAIIQRR